jgi:putative ABC transport system ATP-binding protein
MVGIGRRFPGPPPTQVLTDINFEVRQGDYLAIVGPSGSGKSTLLNLLGLLDRPSLGTYLINGVATGELSEIDRTAFRGRHIGFVFQEFHLLAYRTAAENAALGLTYIGVPPKQRMTAAREALTRVGLGHRLEALPSTLSGGERQRVAIARALVMQPSLLLCDEPTGNLDSRTGEQILDLFDELHADGVTIIVITHDAMTARRATHQITIQDGRLDRPRVDRSQSKVPYAEDDLP